MSAAIRADATRCPNCGDEGTIGVSYPAGIEPCGDCVAGAIVCAERAVPGGPATYSRRACAVHALRLASVARDSARVSGGMRGRFADPRRRAYLAEQARNAVEAAAIFRAGGRGRFEVLP